MSTKNNGNNVWVSENTPKLPPLKRRPESPLSDGSAFNLPNYLDPDVLIEKYPPLKDAHEQFQIMLRFYMEKERGEHEQ